MNDFKAFKTAAVRYWERRRIAYNLALAVPALLGYEMVASISVGVEDLPRISTGAVIGLFVVSAVCANICFSLAYALEFLFGNDAPDAWWLRWGRTITFVIGTMFATVLAFFGGVNIGRIQYG